VIGIIDYGMGNLRSVQKALERLGARAEIISNPCQLLDYSSVILPGVGAFRDAIHELHKQDFVTPIQDYTQSGKSLLGICLGMQLLFDRSFEDGDYEGLGIIKGDVVRFEPEPDLKIPHMGWNSLEFAANGHPLLNGLQAGSYVYFVHSYYVRPASPAVITAQTRHGSQKFVSMVNQSNVYATQFHPEKSQQVGLRILKNFVEPTLLPT